jgi:hypothetical protein
MQFPFASRHARSTAFSTAIVSALAGLFLFPMSIGAGAQDGMLGGLQNLGWTSDRPIAGPKAPEQTRRPKGMPRFLDPAIHPAIGLEGNYYATMDGIAGMRGMYVTIKKGGRIGGSKLHKFYEWTRNPKAKWRLYNYAAVPGGRRIGGQFDSLAPDYYRGKLKVFPNGRMTFVEPMSGGLPRPKRTGVGYGYYKFQVMPADQNFRRLKGRWQDEKKNKGRLDFRRLVPKIKVVSIDGVRGSSGKLYKNQVSDTRRYGGIPPTLILPTKLKQDFHAKAYSSMRGNRPGLIVKIYGDEMWGQHYVWIDPASDIEVTYRGAVPIRNAQKQVIGSQVYLNLWQEVKEGPHTLYFDGRPVVFNIKKGWKKESAEPKTVLETIDLVDDAGTTLDAVGEGQAFQIRAVYKTEHPDRSVLVTIPGDKKSGERAFQQRLIRTANKSVFESEFLRLDRAERNDAETLWKVIGPYKPGHSRRAVRNHFQGEWDIYHFDGVRKSVRGKSKIFASGDRMLALIGMGKEAKVYESTGLFAEQPVKGKSLFGRLRAMLEERPHLSARYREQGNTNGLGRGRALRIKVSRVSLPLMLSGKENFVPINWRPDNLEQIRLDLIPRPGTGDMVGGWEVRRSNSVVQNARQHWVRNDAPLNYTTTLLDDQLGQRGEDAVVTSLDNNYIYPFSADGKPTIGTKTRLLVVTGKNLPSSVQADFSSDDKSIDYKVMTIPPAQLETYRLNAHKLGKTKPVAGEKAILVQATLKKDIRPGSKTFKLNDVSASWDLAFRDQFGVIRFLRTGATANDPEENLFYPGETVRIGLKAFKRGFPAGKQKIKIEAVTPPTDSAKSGVKRRLIDTVEVKRLPGPENLAASKPLVFDIRRDTETRKVDPKSKIIVLQQGEFLLATPADPLSFFAVPPGAIARFRSEPQNSALWQEALNRVRRCPGVTGDSTKSEFVGKSSKVMSRTILTQLKNRNVTIRNGDHAALILIRDKQQPLVLAENQKLKPYIFASNPRRMALRYHSEARNRGGAQNNAFWKYRKGHFKMDPPKGASGPVPGDTGVRPVPLGETLDLAAFTKKSQYRKRVFAVDAVAEQVARQLKAQYEDTLAAVERAKNARDCNIEELLVIAGQKSERAVAAIMPNLMVKEGKGWRANTTARAYLRSAYLAGNDARALDELSKIDDAYKSMAIALVAAPVAALGAYAGAASGGWAAFAGSAAAKLGLAADAIDLLYFGKKGVESYLQAEKDYYTALGLSPILGGDVVAEAEAKRESGAMAVLGVLSPGIGSLSALRSIRDLRRVEKGRRLLRQKGGLKNLDDLDEAQRLDVDAYRNYLKEAEGSRTSWLLGKEKTDQTLLDDLFAKSPAPVGNKPSLPASASDDPFTDLGGKTKQFDQVLADADGTKAFDDVLNAPPGPAPKRIPDDDIATKGVFGDLAPVSKSDIPLDSETGKFAPQNNVLVKNGNDEGVVQFDREGLGQGSFNAAFRKDKDTVVRVPGGAKRPTE